MSDTALDYYAQRLEQNITPHLAEIRNYEFARQYTECRGPLHGKEGIRSYEFHAPLAEVLPSPL